MAQHAYFTILRAGTRVVLPGLVRATLDSALANSFSASNQCSV